MTADRAHGVSLWLAGLGRAALDGGELARLVGQGRVVGAMTVPTGTAVAPGEDARLACDVLRPVYDATGGLDGRVTAELDPAAADDTAHLRAQAHALVETVGRPNLMVALPGTDAGLSAGAHLIEEGIDVAFIGVLSLDRYRGAMNAYLTGLEQARLAGRDLTRLHSVAAFPVGCLDAEVDARLVELGTPEAHALIGLAGLAHARLARQAHDEVFATPRWANLADDGAHVQRPLWVDLQGDPDAPDVADYLSALSFPGSVFALGEAALGSIFEAAEHESDDGDRRESPERCVEVLDDLERLGLAYHDLVAALEQRALHERRAVWERVQQAARHSRNET